MNKSIHHLLIRNLVRWRWRLGLIAFLVAVSTSISILYGGMLQKFQAESIENIEPLNLPYDILVILPDQQTPRTQFDNLGTYRYESQGGVYRGRSTEIPITIQEAEEILALELQTPFGLWEVWGINTEHSSLQTVEVLGEGTWPEAQGELWVPVSYQEGFKLQIGDRVPMLFVDEFGVKKEFQLVICGGGSSEYDLQKPLITMESAHWISGTEQPNRQILFSESFKYMSNWSLFNSKMEQMYPGATYIYKAMPQLQWHNLMKAVQSPGQWVLLLVFVFMAVSVLTINLMTFLERKQELAVLKTLGISDFQLSFVLFLELFMAGILGFLFGTLIISFVSLLIPSYFADSSASISGLFLKNGLLTVLFFLVAVLYPLLLAKVASVNQLLYAREIPLVVAQYDHIISPPMDWVREMQQEKVQMLKMTVIDGKSLSVILKVPGEKVKKGEVVAFMSSIAGFYYQEWLAPCDGVIQSFETANGKYVIKPEDPLTPLYPYTGLIQARK